MARFLKAALAASMRPPQNAGEDPTRAATWAKRIPPLQ